MSQLKESLSSFRSIPQIHKVERANQQVFQQDLNTMIMFILILCEYISENEPDIDLVLIEFKCISHFAI